MRLATLAIAVTLVVAALVAAHWNARESDLLTAEGPTTELAAAKGARWLTTVLLTAAKSAASLTATKGSRRLTTAELTAVGLTAEGGWAELTGVQIRFDCEIQL